MPPLERFVAMFPLSCGLGLEPVPAGDLGFDELDVQKKLGATRFAALMAKVSQVFSCGHAHYAAGHTKAGLVNEKGDLVDLGGYEVHCVYANDLENFLRAGG